MRSSNGRSVILTAARNTFAKKGFDGASIRDIAQEADLSLSALYYYFPSKQDALFELIRSAFAGYIETAARVIADAGDDPIDQTAAVVRLLVRYRAHNQLISRVVVRDAERLDAEKFEVIHEQQRASRAVLNDRIAAGVTAGAFDVEDAELAGRAVLSICNSIALWYRADGPISVAELERTYLQYCLRLLGHSPDDTELDRLMDQPLAIAEELDFIAQPAD
ncbi:TetR family transcriptional regulator [Brevibacterium luteolum]|uniref:TetR family transcriptional regulator n=1 Tax=Brevibacterium luteolum TaxID=199591 RepID=UPI0038794EE8